jgi:hypothetical protein
MDLIAYLDDALSRIAAGAVDSPSGSWAAGIFGKAARAFEGELRSCVSQAVGCLGIEHDRCIDCRANGPLERKTLGQLVHAMRDAAQCDRTSVATMIPAGRDVEWFADQIERINQTWVSIKHGSDVPDAQLVTTMESMLAVVKGIHRPSGECRGETAQGGDTR